VARNRQRAKERQARRKSGRPDAPRSEEAKPQPPATPPEPDVETDGARDAEEIRDQVDLEVGAPPEDLGRSDEVLDDEPDLGDDEHFDPAADHPEEDLVSASSGPKGRRGESEADHKDRPRFVQFLFAVRAELARVQWPNRQALTTLTGVVLGFVLIAGGYLGLLDAIFSRLIQAIL
jgi:preprotein translocase SecE subunit